MSYLKLLSNVKWRSNRVLLNAVVRRAYSDGCQESGGIKNAVKQNEKVRLDVAYVYGLPGNFELSSDAKEIDEKSGGKISRALSESACCMQTGKALLVTQPTEEISAVALAFVGPKDACYDALEHLDIFQENQRVALGAAVLALAERDCFKNTLIYDSDGKEASGEASALALWCREGREILPDPSSPFDLGKIRGICQNWARYLSEMPANMMTPVDLAQEAIDVLCPLGVKVEVRDLEWIRLQNMQAFLAVARGSCEPPMFLECSYDGPGATSPPVLIVAKGVTFDSGGLCLKKPESMVENRGSMAGVAVALGAIRALAYMKVPVRVRLLAPLCENMVSGQCMKVGDVVRALNGLSIVIEDTDLEGRLMMADALVYGQAVHKPSVVVTVATLTHGVLLATGGGAFGCFSNSDELYNVMQKAGAHSGDRPWRFPLWNYYHKQIINDTSADLRNKGSGKATPCLGAAFLKNFVCGGDWIHMDITGVGKLAHESAPTYLNPRLMSGRPTRTLIHFLTDIAKPPEENRPPSSN